MTEHAKMNEAPDDEIEMDACEICGEKAGFDKMTSCGDGCWMCPTCVAKAFRVCKHEATTWRPVESAPTEDIFFLIAGAGRVFVTRGSIFTAARKTNVPEHLSLRWVTQWAPLPPPPKEPTP